MQKSALRRRITPSVPFTLKVEDADGSKFELNFKLSYDFNAMALVEEKTGLSMMSGEVFANPSAKKTTVLLWAGIQANNPDYAGDEGLDAIGTLLNISTAAEALLAITEAFFAALPKEKADAIRASIKGETPAPADPTNAPSA
jgi:hypothetical protein